MSDEAKHTPSICPRCGYEMLPAICTHCGWAPSLARETVVRRLEWEHQPDAVTKRWRGFLRDHPDTTLFVLNLCADRDDRCHLVGAVMPDSAEREHTRVLVHWAKIAAEWYLQDFIDLLAAELDVASYHRGRSHEHTETAEQLADLTARLKQLEAERDALQSATGFDTYDQALSFVKEQRSMDDMVSKCCIPPQNAEQLAEQERRKDELRVLFGNAEAKEAHEEILRLRSSRDAALAKLADVEKERDAATRQRERVDRFRERLQTRHRLLLNDLGVTKDLCDALQSRLAAVEAGAAKMRETLQGIADADWRKWDDGLNTPEEFVKWSRVRAAHALSATAGTELLEDLKTLRTALEQYADPGNWHVGSKYDGESRRFTGPEEARKALEQVPNPETPPSKND